jgi:predicted RNA binding protein YcfA (HicA-like mRNA interferase family)
MASSLSSREIIEQLRADDWVEVRRTGSHRQFRHPVKPGTVTVQHPRKDVPHGTRRSIERQAGRRFI